MNDMMNDDDGCCLLCCVLFGGGGVVSQGVHRRPRPAGAYNSTQCNSGQSEKESPAALLLSR